MAIDNRSVTRESLEAIHERTASRNRKMHDEMKPNPHHPSAEQAVQHLPCPTRQRSPVVTEL